MNRHSHRSGAQTFNRLAPRRSPVLSSSTSGQPVALTIEKHKARALRREKPADCAPGRAGRAGHYALTIVPRSASDRPAVFPYQNWRTAEETSEGPVHVALVTKSRVERD